MGLNMLGTSPGPPPPHTHTHTLSLDFSLILFCNRETNRVFNFFDRKNNKNGLFLWNLEQRGAAPSNSMKVALAFNLELLPEWRGLGVPVIVVCLMKKRRHFLFSDSVCNPLDAVSGIMFNPLDAVSGIMFNPLDAVSGMMQSPCSKRNLVHTFRWCRNGSVTGMPSQC